MQRMPMAAATSDDACRPMSSTATTTPIAVKHQIGRAPATAALAETIAQYRDQDADGGDQDRLQPQAQGQEPERTEQRDSRLHVTDDDHGRHRTWSCLRCPGAVLGRRIVRGMRSLPWWVGREQIAHRRTIIGRTPGTCHPSTPLAGRGRLP